MENMNLTNAAGNQNPASENQLAVSSMIGSSIISRDGDTLGKLHDMVINVPYGKIEYVLIEFGGFMGLNQKYFTLSFELLTVAKEHRNAFIINETKESIKRFLSFDKDHLPTSNLATQQ